MRYAVETNTYCEGWVNCWHEDDVPLTFATRQEAQSALLEHIADHLLHIGEELDPSDFRVVTVD